MYNVSQVTFTTKDTFLSKHNALNCNMFCVFSPKKWNSKDILQSSSGFEQTKKHKKIAQFQEKTQFQQKKSTFDIIIYLKKSILFNFFTQKYPFLTCLKLLTTSLSVFFDILNMSNFTNCQTPLMTIVSHKNLKK